MRRLRFGVAAVVATLIGMATAMPAASAAASTQGRIVALTSRNGQLQVVFEATGLPAGVTLSPSTVQLSIDGSLVQETAVPVSAAAQQVQRTAVVIIDTSGSMAGTGIAGAKAAALGFLSSLPAGVRVGLISFSDRVHVLAAPTTDSAALRSAIGGLRAGGETALFDAIDTGLHLSGPTGARTVLVMTDGGDTVSHLSLGTVEKDIRASGITVDAVGFRTTETQTGALAGLAAAGRGHVLNAAGAGDLATAFAETARDIANQVLITAAIPRADSNRAVSVSVTATAGGTPLTDSEFVQLGSAAGTPVTSTGLPGPIPVAVPHGALHTHLGLGIALTAIFLALLLILGTALTAVRVDSARTRVTRRLSLYTLTGRGAQRRQETTALGDSAVARSAVELAGRMVQRGDFEQSLARRLDAAGLPFKPAEWLLIHAGIAIGLGLLALLVSGLKPLPMLIGLAVGAVGPWLFLSVKEAQRFAAFLAELPDTLQLMAGSLTAGYSLPQAIDAVVREGANPIKSEFNKVLVENRLGVPLEDAMESVANRMRSRDFEWVVMAIRIQREVGGNLAEVLNTVANTLREREFLRRQVRVLSAEGRLSAIILYVLPFLFAGYLVLVRPGYLHPLYSDPAGVVMIVIGGVLMVIGGIWLRQVVKVEI